MRHNRLSIGLKAALAIFTVTLLVTNCRATVRETVLHSFNPSGAEAFPYAGLIVDHAGNLYGTTYRGGTYNVGTVFELSRNGNVGWTQKVLHSFNNNGVDGMYPYAGLIFDSAGNLYTTTQNGGIYYGGTVVKLSPSQGGGWTETVLHNFNPSTTDGFNPLAGLIVDRAGNLYGTTSGGGSGTSPAGTVFELSPSGSVGWTEKVLHNFNNNGTDGAHPFSGLVLDGSGNLYGTTTSGGSNGDGVVFELSPNGSGGWTEMLLHSFNGTDGGYPGAALIFDGSGNLYGTTENGGANNFGTVFELSPNGSGGWTETLLHSFNFNGSDGVYPYAGVIFDAAGNLYGTTWEGGTYVYGTVFELMPQPGGSWSETVLHSFQPNGVDGVSPQSAGLIVDAAGHLFGTTINGGRYNVGTMFEMSHNGNGSWIENVYSFDYNGTDGATPDASLISDAAGNFYGTTSNGGTSAAGTAFEMSPNGSGGWTEKLLYSFGEGLDGFNPEASLIFDAAGNLYGTTLGGSMNGGGMAFKLSPNGSGSWTETVLHSFSGGTDGSVPYGALIFDGAGNLYGTTSSEGIDFYGIAFELSPNGSGGWTETVLHSFGAGTDGSGPTGSLIFDGGGNLYGATYAGGTSNVGTVFELSPNGSGGWTESVLYSFNNNGSDGNYPYAGLVFDSAGNLYGTTYYGGTSNQGSIFKLSPNGGGGWTETVLHSFDFNFNETDGAYPTAGVIFDHAGNLYGTTDNGGTCNYGTAFEFSPAGGGNWTETVLHSFCNGGADGYRPFAGLIIDHAGNLYGTTSVGGSGTSAIGTVFEIAP